MNGNIEGLIDHIASASTTDNERKMESISLLIEQVSSVAPILYAFILAITITSHVFFVLMRKRQIRETLAAERIDEMFDEVASIEKQMTPPEEIDQRLAELQRNATEIDETALPEDHLTQFIEIKARLAEMEQGVIHLKKQDQELRARKLRVLRGAAKLRSRIDRRKLILNKLGFIVSVRTIDWFQTLIGYLTNSPTLPSQVRGKLTSSDGRSK